MKPSIQTQNAKQFLKNVNLSYIKTILSNINFTEREKEIINHILNGKSIKEISIIMNLSLSYIAHLKQIIYEKIDLYINLIKTVEEKNNIL